MVHGSPVLKFPATELAALRGKVTKGSTFSTHAGEGQHKANDLLMSSLGMLRVTGAGPEGLTLKKLSCKVKMVDGSKIRDTKDVSFIGGGNHEAYPKMIPKGEIWIEEMGDKKDEKAILKHEKVEQKNMEAGDSYSVAHHKANVEEAKMRGAPPPEKGASFLGLEAFRIRKEAMTAAAQHMIMLGNMMAPKPPKPAIPSTPQGFVPPPMERRTVTGTKMAFYRYTPGPLANRGANLLDMFSPSRYDQLRASQAPANRR